MKYHYNVDNIRFMGCGEYGDGSHTDDGQPSRRPHYHIILFNCPLPAETFYNPRISWGKDTYYQNKIIEKCWDKGISNITEANWNNIAYTARYITKKVKGKESNIHYALLGQEKEFFRTSRMPGIARDYYEAHKEDIYKKDTILVKNKKGSHWVQPPKYFDKLYEKENPKRMEELKERRRRRMIAELKRKALTTSLTRAEQLEIECHTKTMQSKILKRGGSEQQAFR